MISGQINIFDYLVECKIKENSVLQPGQKVWMVIRGDIKEYKIANEKPWMHNENYVYRLQHGSGSWWTMSANEIGNIFFIDNESAKKKVDEYFRTHTDVIFADQIKPIEIKAYSYIRECDKKELYSYYAILPDGKVYIKEFMTYEHIVDYKNIESAKKAMERCFFKQQAFEYAEPKEKEVVPIFKNMYRCEDGDNWLYACAEYGRCI